MRLGEQPTDQTGQAPVGITNQQCGRGLPGEQGIQRSASPGTSVQLGKGDRRDGYLPVQSPRSLQRPAYLALGGVTRIKQRIHGLRVKHDAHSSHSQRLVGLLDAAKQAHKMGDFGLVLGTVKGPAFIRQSVQQIPERSLSAAVLQVGAQRRVDPRRQVLPVIDLGD